MKARITPDTLRDVVRANLSKYTRAAFESLTKMERPRILDAGRGSGVPTVELGKSYECDIVAVDIDRAKLALLEEKLSNSGLKDKISTVKCSIKEMSFKTDSFDIIWSEGSIFAVGFERGLREWGRFLKPGGFLAVHDERSDLETKIECISRCGYDLLDYFVLDHTVWRDEFYAPLERKIDELISGYGDGPESSADLEKERREISLFKEDPRKFESVFFVLRKSKL
jgi:ubiquinone/menaquinone biosynthesis C-methylase UbiE